LGVRTINIDIDHRSTHYISNRMSHGYICYG